MATSTSQHLRPSSQELLYKPHYGVQGIEDLEDYKEGGLHPVNLLDVLGDRFEVCHKLGSGGIATVWLCYEAAQERWRAVKVNAASRSSETSPELTVAKHFKDAGINSHLLAAHHVLLAEETFWIEGPNGKHLCSVLPVLGPTLPQWRRMSLGADAERIKKVCYDITEGIDYLHKNGICHGDFRPHNILMCLTSGGFDNLKPNDFFQLVGFPQRHEVHTNDGLPSTHAPKFVVEPLKWFRLQDFISDNVAIVDFGEAFATCSPPVSLGIPAPYASPEAMYGGPPFGEGVDVWSLAITLLETRTGEPVGDSMDSPLALVERLAGPIPPPYRAAAAEELYMSRLRDFEDFGEEEGMMEKPAPPSEELLLLSPGRTQQPLTGFFHLDTTFALFSDAEDGSIRDGIEAELSRELWEKMPVSEDTTNAGSSDRTATEVKPYRIPRHEVVELADLLRKIPKIRSRGKNRHLDGSQTCVVLAAAFRRRLSHYRHRGDITTHAERIRYGAGIGCRKSILKARNHSAKTIS